MFPILAHKILSIGTFRLFTGQSKAQFFIYGDGSMQVGVGEKSHTLVASLLCKANAFFNQTFANTAAACSCIQYDQP